MNQTYPAPSHLRKQSPALAWMRQYLRVPVTGVLIASFSLWSAQVRGATLVWDGGTNTWDVGTTLNWNGGGAWANSNNNIALFGGTVGTVTLGAPITAGGLIFNSSGYTIASDTLTLAAPTGVQSPIIAVNNNGFGTNRATVSSLLAGTSGFTKTGNGTLVLSNNSNSFSGDIAIKGGSLVVTNAGQLGTGTTAISVTGVAQTGNPGFSGGMLVLQGTTNGAGSSGVTLNREVSITGRGPGAANNTGALVSVGYNTLAGNLTISSAVGESRAWASHGTTTISGDVFLGSGTGNYFYGNGNWNISGLVSGLDSAGDRLIKTGNLVSTTLWLQNANNSYLQPTRIDSGTVRVAVSSALGMNTGTGQVDLNNGMLEVRTDSPTSFANRTVRLRNNVTGTIFVDHDLAGGLSLGSASLQNQTVTFGALIRDGGNATANFNYVGRNGYNISFASALPSAAEHRQWTINNNSNGTVTYNGNTWNNTGTTANTYTVQGNAETIITGSVIASGAAHNLTKSGQGTFIFGGTASTYTGATGISQGTLAFSNVGGFATTSQINIGNATTTPGTLTYTGAAATLSKNILFNTTTAPIYINASGTGALTYNGTFLNTVNGAHTLILGGTSTDDNTIAAVIPINTTPASVTSLQKIGTGTWVLAPTANNTFTGSTTVSNGTLKLTDGAAIDLLPDAGAVIFNVDAFSQSAGGTLVYTGGANTETVGALTATTGHGTLTAASGTLTFASLGVRTAGATINVSNTGTINIGGTAGFINAGTYFNSTNFAYSGAGTTLRAPVYGTDAGFVDAAAGAATLTAGSHNQVVGAITAQTSAAINSLKISGANDLTLDAAQTLTVGTGTLGAGILLTGGSSTISGGTAIAASAAGNDFAVRVDGANTLTINTPMTVSTAGLSKSGAGTLILGAVNTYSGTVSINEGMIQMGTGGRLGADNIGLTIRQGASLDLNGVSLGTVASGTGSVNALNGSGTITNSGALATLRVGNNNASGYFTGPITGANLHLVKNGSGTLSLTNNTSDFGTLTISAGTVAFALPAGTTTMNAGVASPLGTGAAAANLVFNGGTLLYTGSNATIFSATQSPSFSTNREFTLAANGTIQSSGQYGNNVLAGGAQNNASIIFSNTADLTFSGAGVRTLTLGGNSIGDNEMRIRLRDNPSAATDYLSLTKADAGLWILNPVTSNTYGGTTTISAGALRVASSAASVQGLSASSPLVINGGVLETSGTFTRTLGAPVAGTGTTVQIPGGASGFAAATTDRLVVTLGGGALTWGSTNFAPTSLILGSSTALGETEITNDIAIGAATRTITVNNNGNTGTMVTAGILSGVISGPGTGGNALIKNGSGVLILGNANTYTGSTRVDSGTLVVTSIGTGASSSLGASGALILRNPGNGDLNPLIYVGAGETASRALTLTQSGNFTGNRITRIDSSGSGPLIWDSGTFVHDTRGDTVARVLTLDLRGSNVDNNQMNLVLTNSTNATFANTLAVTKSDGGTWILNPPSANTFTGGLSVGGGNLGLTANGIGAATAITVTNSAIFAYGGPLTTSAIIQGNNSTSVISGQNSITVGGMTKTAGNNQWTISNNLENGALLTVNGNFVNNENGGTAATQTISIRGYGSTIWNGVIGENAAAGGKTAWSIALHPDAFFRFDGGSANTYTGITSLSQGTMILNKTLGVAQIGTGTSQFNFGGGVLRSDAGNLTGANSLGNTVFLTGDPATVTGTNSIELTGVFTNNAANRLLVNSLSGGANLTLTGNVSLSNDNTGRILVMLGSGTTNVNGVVQNGGTGAGSLTYSGNGTLNLSGANTATGNLTLNRGTTVLGGANGSWAGNVVLNGQGTLRLDNSVTNNDNRLLNTGTMSMAGGVLEIIGNNTTEITGALTTTGPTAINMSGVGTNSLTFSGVTFTGSSAHLDLSGVTGLGTSNKIIFTTSTGLGITPATTGIVPRAMMAGDFVGYDNTNGLVPFTGYNTSNNLNSAANTDTMEVTATAGLTANRTLNAIKIDGSGLTVGSAGRYLTLTSANILNTGGNNTLTFGQIIQSAQGFIQVDSGTTLDVNASFTNTIHKTGAGQMNLNTVSFHNTTTNVSNGTLQLNGGLNTLFANGTGTPGGLNLDAGGTVDLKGNIQYVGALSGFGSGLPGTAGTLTTSTGTPLFVTRDGGTFGGQITGTMNLGKLGANALILSSANSVAGTISVQGGSLNLRDDGTLLNTTSLDLNYATLTFDNNASTQTQNNNRFNDAAPITLRGGNITYNGRVAALATETLGAITLAQGANTITATSGGGTFGSVDLFLGALTRSAGATVNFTGSNLGQQGNNSRIVFASTPAVVGSGILGAWAIANTTDYAAYNADQGVGVVGQGGYAGYTAQVIAAANTPATTGVFAAGNITNIVSTVASSVLLPAGTTTTSLLRVGGAFTTDVLFTGGSDTLHLELGGILRSDNNNAASIGTTAIRGVITSGTNELVTYNNQNTLTINSVINGALTLIKDGAGTLALTAPNTYSLGTVVNRGTLTIAPTTLTDVVIPAGGLTINGGVTGTGTAVTAVNSTNIAASNDIILNGRAGLTFTTASSAVNSLTLNNIGGEGNPTVTIGTGTLSLTSSSPITATSSNAASTATITGGIVSLAAGTNTISVAPIQIGSQIYTTNQPALNIASALYGSGAINKTGNGLLMLSGQSAFNGLNVNSTGIIVNASSTNSGGAVMTGPLGVGPVAMASGTRMLTNGSFSVGNDISFAGTPTFDATSTNAWTLTLTGNLTGAGLTGGTPTIEVTNPGTTVALLGNLPAASSYTKTGLGTLVFNATNYSGNFNATDLGNPNAIQLIHDGDRTGSVQTISMGSVTFDSGIVPNITVNRGGSLPFGTAANKILAPSSITNTGLGLTVTNSNGYGLQVSDATAFTATPTINVGTATASNVIQGLYLTGDLTGTGFIKTGAGTVVLNNGTPADNTFTGNIDIRQGVVSVNDDAQLGNAGNSVLLNPTTGTSTFRATGTFATSRTINLNTSSNTRSIEVTSGNTLTLNSAFGLTGGASTALVKADLGTLVLGASNAGWSGNLTINAGVVSPTAANTLTTGTIIVNETSAALQLSGGLTITNPLTIDVLANGRVLTGLNTGGAFQSVSGSNTIGTVTVNATHGTDNQARSYGFGADNGATLNIGTVNFNHPTGGTSRNIIGYYNTQGTGAINVTGVIDNLNASPGANTYLFKVGNGTMTLSAANAIPDTEVRVYRGNMTLNGAATFGSSGANTQVQVWQSGSLTFDNSTTNTSNRFSNRVVQIGGGTLNFIPNAAGTTHTSTGALQISQGANTINLAAGGNQTVTFASLTQNAGATLNMIGTFGSTNNKLTFTTAPTLVPATTGILARVTTNGNEFATYSAANGILPFTAYAGASNILSATATQTYKATPATANSLTGNQTLNALNLNTTGGSPNVGGLGGLLPTRLALTSGGILVNGSGSAATLSVPIVDFAGVEAVVHVASGLSLNVTSGLAGTAGLTKSLDGTLNLNQQQYVSGNTIVNGGTLNLQSGATNTLLFNNGLGINNGATVDLKNGVQFIGSLFSANGGGNTDLGGGIVTNTGAQATLVTNSNSNFNGQINGTIYLNKTGTNSLNLQSAHGYSGPTFITGGTLNLADDGTILNTSAIDINFGTLAMTNTNLRDNANRVNDATAITLKGGTLSFQGRAQANSSETLGAVTLVEGHNNIFANDADIGIGSGVLTIASLTRSVGSVATLRFNNAGDFGLIGTRGRVMITAAPTLTNNIIGAWAVVDRELASYDTTYGVGTLNQTGFAGYSANSIYNAGATDNIRLGAVGTTNLAANTTVGTLTFGQQNAATTLDLGTNTLTVQGGALVFGQATDNVTFTVQNGNVTGPSGGGDLYIHHLNYTGTNRLVSMNAAITDNGGAVRVIKTSGDTGASVMTWNGTNTFTGGLVIDQGTVTLGATGTLNGGGGITVLQGSLIQTAGGVIPTQALTLGGPATVTLAGNNTLTGLTINNLGGAAPTLNPTGVLTLTGGISVTTVNAGAVATISNGTLDLNGAGAYSINVGATTVNGQDVAPWQAGLIINSVIQNGGISKSGTGVLQLGGASTFAGGVNITSGGLIIASDTNSLLLNDPVVTGPVGTGTLTLGANTSVLAGGAARTITNNVTILGDTVFNGTNNLTFNGTTTLPAIWGATVTAPQMTVTIGDASPSLSSDVINKSGLGTLVVGNYAGTINATGGLLFTADGNTLSTVESLSLGGNVSIVGDTALTVNRSGGAPNARNKILQKVDLANSGSILSVSNQSGYGLEFTGTTTLSAASHFAVGVATASNVVQGLILSGVVSDTSGFDFIKSGPGALVLGNSGNTFGGAGKTIDILNGILSVASDGALGNVNNTITLNVDGSTGVGLRATGTFSTARTLILNQANNAIEVTAGNTLTLTSPFSPTVATNNLAKNDNGVLVVNADNSGWTPAITINAGAIEVNHANALGTPSAITINNAIGSALLLGNGVTFAQPITLNVNGLSGFNNGGVIQAVGTGGTYSGLITQGSGFAVIIGAAAGSTLNITGGIATANTTTFNAGAGGTINLSGGTFANGGAGGPNFTKIGKGDMVVSVASPAAVSPIINALEGTLTFSGAGLIGTGSTVNALVDVGATLTLDNTTTNVVNRLGGTTRTFQMRGGNFNLIGNTAANTSESLAAPTFSRGYSVVTVTAQPGFQADLTFTGSITNPVNAQNATSNGSTGASVLFRGTNLGSAAGAGVATIKDTGGTNGFNFFGQSGANGTATKGIMPWALVDTTTTGNGVSFATGDGTTFTTSIVRPLASNEYAAVNTFANNSNINLTSGSISIGTANRNINSLTMAGNAATTINSFLQLTSSSGGILVKSGTSTISGGVLSQINTAAPFNIWTLGDLSISSLLNGGNGTASGAVSFVKAGAGTLTLSTPQSIVPGLPSTVSVNSLSGQTVINQGTLKLNGGTNTIQPNNFLSIHGGTLDLNGNTQQVLGLFTDNAVAGAGGTITSSTGTGNLIINQDNAGRNWAGTITGNVNVTRSGSNTLTIYSPQTYTGTTLINAATTTLRDEATLSGTTAITINYATLNADNNAGTMNLTDRINDAAPISMRGATLTVLGRAQTASTEALGAVSIIEGFNVINPNMTATGLASQELTLASLSRPAGSAATLIVQGNNLGTIGSNSRVFVTTLNGVATTNPAYSANGSGLTNNIVGGWAENGNDFLTYIPGMGLAALNQVGAPQYDKTNTFVGSNATENIRLTATTVIPNGGANVNAVSMTGSNIALNFATATDTLNITSGGLIGPNNNQSIGNAVDSGRLTAGGSSPAALNDLYVFNRANTLTINSRIVDNGANAVRAVFTASGGVVSLTNTNNSYTGGTVVNGGTLNLVASTAGQVIPAASTPANGLIINGATVTMGSASNTLSQQIAASNIVTLTGGSALNLFGDNTLAGLVFNNNGGGTPTVTSFGTVTSTGLGSAGVLTIGSSGVVATSSNVGTTNVIVGRVDFGTSLNTIDVAPIIAQGVEVNPLQAALAIQGIVGTTGGINKIGNGILQFNAQAHYSGPTNVTAGGIRTGVQNGGSRLSALTLGSGTTFNINGTSTTWGSLAGSGTVFNTGGANTLTVGFDNTDTAFSGQLARFNDAVVNAVGLQKIGTGVMSMTSAQSFATGTTGTITINGGTLKYVDAGAAFPGTAASGGGRFTLNSNGILALDNAGTSNVNNRLGLNAIGTLDIQGGKLTINGTSTASTPTTETITTFNVTNGNGRIELSADAANPLTLAITTLNTANGNGSLVVTGINGAASANGVARLTITTPNLISGQGTGINGTVTMGVRHDILADASVSGLGTGFLVKDSVTNNYRALASNELLSSIALPLTTDVDTVTAGNQGAGLANVGLAGVTQGLMVNSVANTLTFSGTSTVNSGLDAAFGIYGPGGGLLNLSLSQAAASLVLAGGTANISVGNFGSTSAGTTMYSHVIAGATLNVNSYFGVGNTGGFLKADGGAFNLNNKAYYTGATNIGNGTLKLGSGAANTIAVVPTTGAATMSALSLNSSAAILDLNGQNQAVGVLSSINPLPGMGGTITSTGAAIFTTVSNGNSTFGGVISGAISLVKGNDATARTLTLTNANTYTGATTIRGGTLQLRDSGSISSTAGLTAYYGTLLWDNFGLNPSGNPNPTRVAAANPVTLQGGTLTFQAAGSSDTTSTLNSITMTGGQNTINTLPFINEGSTVKLTIGNLIRNTATHSGVNFNGFTTNNSGGSNTLGGQGLTTNSNIIINQLNGTAFSASNLVNNLIGGWAVADGSTFATYSNTFGVVAMGNTYGGFAAPNFTGTDITAATVATGNYNDAGTGTTAITRTMTTGAKLANSWRFAQSGAATTVTPVSGTTYSFGVGIITNANRAVTLGAVDATNTITGTGSDLYFYVNQNTLAIQPAIIGSAALVSNGGATLSLRPQFASNTYSGGTYVNAGTLNLQAASGLIAVPAGGLFINNAAVTMDTTPNQIDPSNIVTINGGGSLTLANYTTGPTQTLNSVVFNNEGGAANPTLSLGTPTTAVSTLVLSNANPITVTNNSLGTTPTISTGAATLTALQFSDANPVITINAGLAETGLLISAPITQHANMLSLSKSGNGALALSGANTFTTGFNLNQGSLIFGASSAGTPPAITSGPVGTGALTIAGGTSLLSDGTIRTIGNATTVNGDFVFGGRVAGNGVILSGAMDLGAAGRIITVDSPAVTSTISGAITSTATGTAITKAGNGTLVLSSATNNFGGASVAVTGGILKNGVANAVPTGSAVAVSTGAGYDLNNFDQTIDALNGTGFVTNSGNSAKTLTVSSTVNNSTFTGVLTDNILGAASSRLNVVKGGVGTTLTLGSSNTYSGTTTINAGTIEAPLLANGGLTSSLGISSNAPANLVINGGTLAYTGSGATNGTTDRQFTIGTSGATLSASGASGSPMVFTSTTSPTLAGTDTARSLTLSGTNTDLNTLAAGLGDNGTGATSFVKDGAGTWQLTAASTITGTTSVNGGTLLVNNSTGSGTGTGAVTVNSTGTLGGSGTIVGGVTIGSGGILSPGSTAGTNAGTINLDGNLSMAGSGSAETRLAFGYTNATGNVGGAWISANGANWWNAYTGSLLTGNGGQSNDLVNLTASSGSPTLTWDTGGKVSLSQLGSSYTWLMGDVLNLLDWTTLYNSGGSISGTFDVNADFDLPTLGSGLEWDKSRFLSTGAIAVIPEPSRAMLLLLGLLGLSFFRRRR